MRRILLLLPLLWAFSSQAGNATAQTSTGGAPKADSARKDTVAKPDTVRYDSDSLEYDAETRRTLLYGHAHLLYRTTKLSADTIDFDQTSQVLDAQGNPNVDDPQIPPFWGTRLKYNLKSRYGLVYLARSYRNGEYYRGQQIRRFPDKTMQIIDGDFCKCQNVDEPDYYFAAERMEMEPEKQATGAPVVLNIEDVPVLVMPFIYFPLGKGRRSGFLSPKFGGDQKQGFYAKNLGYYWGISDYFDLTTTSDVIEGSTGKFDQINGDANFRYALRDWLSGNLEGKSYVDQLGGAGSGWEVNYTHDQQLLPQPNKFTLKGDGRFVSSYTTLTNNATTTEDLLNQTANAEMTLNYQWDHSSASLTANQYENLRTGVRTRELPGATFTSSAQIFPTDDVDDTAWYRDLRYSYNARVSSYSSRMADSVHTWQDSVYRYYLLNNPDSAAYHVPTPLDQRYMGAVQTLALTATKKVGYVDFTATANARDDWTAYSYSEPPQPSGIWRTYSSDHYHPDQFLTWNVSAGASTNLYGTWLPYWGRWAGLRHTLTPSVSYVFTPHVDSAPFFVANPKLVTDAYHTGLGQAKSEQIQFSLGQKIDTKILPERSDTAKSRSKKGESYSILTFSTSTGYDFVKTTRPWSDITTTFNSGIPLVQFNGTLVHTLYDPYGDSTKESLPTLKSWSLSFQKSASVAGSFSDGWRWDRDSVSMQPWTLGLQYSYNVSATRVSREVFKQTRTQSAAFSATLKPSRAWSASWKSNYDFELGSFNSHSLTFHRSLGCWDINFGWTPVGTLRGWNFLIQIRDLPDAKIQAQSSTLHKVNASSTSTTE
jgi:hypothetical protein